MIFKKPYSSIIIIAILILISAVSLLFDVKSVEHSSLITAGKSENLDEKMYNGREGFELVPFATDPSTKKIVKGYYQVDKDRMALLPYGFGLDPNDPHNILPVTKVGINMLKPRYNAPIPKSGEKMPTDFYLLRFCTKPKVTEKPTTTSDPSKITPPPCDTYDLSLAVLPPNMMPNLESIDFTEGSKPRILYKYAPGYISETQYYENIFKVSRNPDILPTELYYTDAKRKHVSFLQYGQIMDPSNGYGAIKNPSLDLYTDKYSHQESGYKDIKNNYSTQFHDDIETIKKNNDMYDLSFGEVRVKDQNGNIIILPKTESQGSVTYYEPGSFPFGSSLYVPNYEDSVYLSSVINRSPFGQTKLANCSGACNAYTEFKTKMEKYCDKK